MQPFYIEKRFISIKSPTKSWFNNCTKGKKFMKNTKGSKKTLKIMALALITMLLLTLVACNSDDINHVVENVPERGRTSENGEADNNSVLEGHSADYALEGDSVDDIVDIVVGGVDLGEVGDVDSDMRMSDDEHHFVEPIPPAGGETQYPDIELLPIEPGQLTAGEWNDNANLDLWNSLFRNAPWRNFPQTWGLSTANRIIVNVTNGDSPIRNARVELFGSNDDPLWVSRTDHNGRAFVFGDSDPQSQTGASHIIVTMGSIEERVNVGSSDTITVDLSGATSPTRALDLMFVIDTTGSMGDELRYLQAELEDVIDSVRSQNSSLPIRLSMNFYRDHGDDYVVLPHSFTEDIPEAIRILGRQSAAGGGDWPEAVAEALENAVFEHDWHEDSIKLMFLVLDAPGHENPESIATINKAVREASEKGIRIIPIQASGNMGLYDTITEFKMRAFSILTGGTYTFLTSDSGIGNPHNEPTIGAFQVEMLNEMLVRIINEYIS